MPNAYVKVPTLANASPQGSAVCVTTLERPYNVAQLNGKQANVTSNTTPYQQMGNRRQSRQCLKRLERVRVMEEWQ